jgi:hypothetical protein
MPVSIRFLTLPGSGVRRVLGQQREGLADDVHATTEEHAEIERREEPLVWIHDERVGEARAVEHVRQSGTMAITPA